MAHKSKEKNTRILIQLPVSLKKYLDDLKQEGYTASAYIRGLLLSDQQARLDTGWQPRRKVVTHRLSHVRPRSRNTR